MTSEEAFAYLQALREEAVLLGIANVGNMKEETLIKKITEAKESKAEQLETAKVEKAKESKSPHSEAMALKRVIITCHDPAKSGREGMYISGGNSKIASVSRYFKFGTPQHLELVLLNVLKEKTHVMHYQERNPVSGEMTMSNRLVSTFTIQELPMLTQKELEVIAKRQALVAANGDLI